MTIISLGRGGGYIFPENAIAGSDGGSIFHFFKNVHIVCHSVHVPFFPTSLLLYHVFLIIANLYCTSDLHFSGFVAMFQALASEYILWEKISI